ncbi:MAG: type V CRISPR-associated protein Cas12a/Cpf1 [Paludibacteraceae bacterium]|nr:type V CRISPR-associated protein Cas12a/Cpf1 [Paludibacteraceae bacterium]
MKESLSHFSGLYSLSKTLRFELIPQGKTLDYIQKNGLLSQDEHRADSYKLVKKIIDEYHKAFIEQALDGLELNLLEEYYLYYQIQKKEDSQKKQFEDIQTKMRKQISDKLTKNEKFKNLFGKELIKDDLQVFVQNVEERELVKEFENFTTYFTGFHENRKNMYSDEEKSTAIAFRLIHQNLPKFIDNMRAFDKIRMSNLKEKFSHILSNSELGPIIQVLTIEDVFSLQYFNQTLTQIGIDKYNQLIGGYTSEDGATKIKGLNEYINLFNQNVKDKNQKLPKLKTLFKQILSDRSTASFIPQQYEDDNAVLESIEKLYQELNEHVFSKQIKGEHSLIELLQNLPEYDLSKIYVRNDTSLTDISQKLYGDWSVIQKALYIDYDQHYTGKKKLGTEQYEEERKKNLKQDSYSIAYINSCLSLLPKEIELKNIETYFALLGKTETEPTLFDTLTKNYQEIKDLLNTPYPDNKNLAQQQVDVEKIKALLDSIKSIQWFIKPLLGKGNEAEKDERFYGEFASLWEVLDQITPIYNKVRNYMTRKPYSTEKIKLNFENSTLMDGWDVNKETDNTSILFKKDGLYYLGIMNKKHNKVFKKDFDPKDTAVFEKMEYKLLPGANKMLPKVFFSNSRIDEFKPSDKLLENYKNETHKKGDNFNIQHCHELIDFFKSSINKHEDWKKFGFQFSDTQSYQDLSGFYREVEQQGYKLSFKAIPQSYIYELVDEGKLYLFQIFNKDFSPYSKGTPNMHTLYWKMLFDEQNLKDVVYKLNGQAEVFYRKASIKNENIVVHKANEAIKNKNEANEKKHSNFNYDLVKDKRYTVDKFQFHVPITMNFKGRGLNNINLEVNEHIRNNEDIHIIGIDRGERHLLYLTLIDGKGNIVEQYSLNEIINEHKGNKYTTNYHTLLDAREGNRNEERRNWKTIESIKELKEGYLSQVIHKISELMVKYNAIVVLEDLNAGFIRGRQKVEKSVYQQFEKMLIDKLNYLVDKKKSATELGGTLKALQLTNKFESFQKMGKQSGFLFYVPAWNTSKIDPVTGFVNFLDTKYENIDKTKTFFKKFKDIRYNSEKGYFEFVIDNYTQFNPKAEGTRQNWTICSYGTRIETFRNADKNNQWDNREINITAEFMKLFGNTTRISEMISQQNDKSFFERLMHLLKLTLQMRNSITNTEIDYLISPVADENGVFFDSRNIDINAGKPMNADANGAFNIARKGLWVIQQIKNPATDLKKIKLAITNKEWLQFVQS